MPDRVTFGSRYITRGHLEPPFPPNPPTPKKKGSGSKRKHPKIRSKKVTLPQEQRAQENSTEDAQPKGPPPKLLKRIIDVVKKDAEFRTAIEGEDFMDRHHEYSPWPIHLGGAGADRNAWFWVHDGLIFLPNKVLEKYSLEEFPKKLGGDMDCRGIADIAEKVIKNRPEVTKDLQDLRSVGRRLKNTPGITFSDEVIKGPTPWMGNLRKPVIGFSYSHHNALLIQVDGEEYILDWHKTLEIENPVIYEAADWFAGNDENGIQYEDYVK